MYMKTIPQTAANWSVTPVQTTHMEDWHTEYVKTVGDTTFTVLAYWDSAVFLRHTRMLNTDEWYEFESPEAAFSHADNIIDFFI